MRQTTIGLILPALLFFAPASGEAYHDGYYYPPQVMIQAPPPYAAYPAPSVMYQTPPAASYNPPVMIQVLPEPVSSAAAAVPTPSAHQHPVKHGRRVETRVEGQGVQVNTTCANCTVTNNVYADGARVVKSAAESSGEKPQPAPVVSATPDNPKPSKKAAVTKPKPAAKNGNGKLAAKQARPWPEEYSWSWYLFLIMVLGVVALLVLFLLFGGGRPRNAVTPPDGPEPNPGQPNPASEPASPAPLKGQGERPSGPAPEVAPPAGPAMSGGGRGAKPEKAGKRPRPRVHRHKCEHPDCAHKIVICCHNDDDAQPKASG